MLFGPVELETEEMSDIYLLTSSCVQGLRVMLKIFRLRRSLENGVFPFGIFCSTDFPIFR